MLLIYFICCSLFNHDAWVAQGLGVGSELYPNPELCPDKRCPAYESTPLIDLMDLFNWNFRCVDLSPRGYAAAPVCVGTEPASGRLWIVVQMVARLLSLARSTMHDNLDSSASVVSSDRTFVDLLR